MIDKLKTLALLETIHDPLDGYESSFLLTGLREDNLFERVPPGTWLLLETRVHGNAQVFAFIDLPTLFEYASEAKFAKTLSATYVNVLAPKATLDSLLWHNPLEVIEFVRERIAVESLNT